MNSLPPRIWLLLGFGMGMILLNTLGLLPCFQRCPEFTARLSIFGTITAAERAEPGNSNGFPESSVPHHHHAGLRGAVEPLLVRLGLFIPTLPLSGFVLLPPHYSNRRSLGAPPTPPPRLR